LFVSIHTAPPELFTLSLHDALPIYNVINSLAAVALGMRLRMSDQEIAQALSSVRLPSMRMEQRRLGDITIINDAYNANPASMRRSEEHTSELQSRGHLVCRLLLEKK